MKWVLITGLFFILNLSFADANVITVSALGNFGLTKYQSAGLNDDMGAQRVTFTIDKFTVEGWDSISAKRGIYAEVQGRTSGFVNLTLPTRSHPLIFVDLLAEDKNRGLAAFDVLVYGVKDTLAFNATNTAHAFMMDVAELYSLTPAQKIIVYKKVEEHSDFSELVGVYADNQGIPTLNGAISRITAIQLKIIGDVLPNILQ